MRDNLEDLRGLEGLSSLSDQERSAWVRLNSDKLKGKSSRFADRLYRNQQYIKKFGIDSFNSYDKDQRDEIYKNTLVDESFIKRWSPYTDKKGADGNFIVDPNKGMGNAEEFQKYFAMDADSKIELMKSGWKPTPQMNKELKQKRENEKKILTGQDAWLGAPAYAQGAATFAKLNSRPYEEKLLREKNNKILERIYAKSLKRRESKLQPQIDDYFVNTISTLSDSEVYSTFMKKITADKNNIGNGQFKAFFHDGKNLEDEVKNFSIDDMRMYLAREKVLTDNLGVGAAHDALTNYAKEYIHDHQSKWTYAGLLAKDVGISVLSYTADKINGIRQLYDLTQGNSVVWIDNKGNVVAPDQVKTDRNGNKYYINEDGKATAIKQTKMSVADLDYLGKDAQGYTRDAMWNNQFWSDAEQYGTLNWDEQRQYKKLGASPYKVVYKPGDESDLLYETIKMTSFGIADAASMAIPVAGESLGTAMTLSKGASMINKSARIVGKGLQYASKTAKGVQPTVGAAAIGHAYGRGVFGENLAQNMQQLEESTYTNARQNFLKNYKDNKDFKDQVDRDVQAEFKKLKSAQNRYLAASEGSSRIVDKDLNDKVLMDRARQKVSNSYINKGAQDIQNSDGYFDMVGKASESASDAAMIAAITDGLKYSLVNNFGYRKFLFNTAADRTASAIRRMSERVSEGENKRLLFKSALDGNKLKTIGKIAASQAWGGAWTNFTDEMQSWGGKQINQDRFSAYLNGFYNGQAADDTYGTMDAVASYFTGALGSLAKDTTWNAGLVGALGSIATFAPNITSIANTVSTRSGREAWRKASLEEKVNMLFSNGILNEYYAKKQGETEIKQYVETVNKLLDEQDNFSILKDAIALDRANLDVSNQEDKNVLNFLKGVKAISLLHQFQNDGGLQDQSNSRIKKWLRSKFGGNENALNAVASQSSILTKALSEVEDIVNGNLDEETTKKLLSEYYAKNPGIEQSEETSKQALTDMTANAKALLDAEKTWQDVNDKLDEVERDRSSRVSPLVRGKLLERAALDGFLSEKIDALEEKISGGKVNTSVTSTPETWGNKKAIERMVLSMEKSKRDLSKAIDKSKAKLDETQTKLKEFESSHDIESLDELQTASYRTLVNDRDAARLQYEYTLNAMDKLKSRQDKMRAMSTEDNSRVLSKEEILTLPSEDRARMLNDANKENYSKEQQEQIDELKKELTMKDPSILQSIQDQARLLKQKNANSSAYEMMLNNPEAAASEFEAQAGLDATVAKDLTYRRYAENVNEVIRKLNNIDGVNLDEVRNAVYKNLRVLHPNILEYLDSIASNEKGLEQIASYKDEIFKAKEWSNMLTDISKAIDKMGFDEATKKVFSENIDKLIDNADTQKQAMDILKSVSEATDVSSADQANFKRLLNIINGVDEQRKSTVTETKEEKKARQESQETQAKQEKKKIQDAEDKVKPTSVAKEKVTEQSKDDLIHITNTSQGLSHLGNLQEWSKKTSDIRNKPDGFGTENGLFYYKKSQGGREGDNVTIWFRNEPSQSIKEKIPQLLEESKNLNEFGDKVTKLINDFNQTSSKNTQETSSQSNIQEVYQETKKEKSNEQNAQEAYTETEQERKNQEEANKQLNTYEQTDEDIARDKAIEKQKKEGVDFSSGIIDFESPDWEKQVEQAEAEGHKIEEGVVAKGTADTTDQGNNFTSTSENMLGNAMYGYDVKALEENAKEVERTGAKPNDKMSRFFNWLKTANIKLQEIIDNELKDILKVNNKLEMLYVEPQANATNDIALEDFSLLCVKYTDAVKRVHNEDRGGIVTANGNQYLIVGTMGFDKYNQAQGDTYRSTLYQGKVNRRKYFTENPSERFFVDLSGHTEVEQMTSGRIVREMVGDTETKVRPVTELLSDSKRNPKGLKLQDLKWGIMFEDGLHYANVSSRNTVYPPRDTLSNLGAVFLLIEAANGNYIPAAIRPTMLSDIQDGALKTQLNNLFNELSSVKYSDRLTAINQIVKLLNIKEKGDNILVGMKDKATVSTVKNDTIIRTFNLEDANFNRMDLINAILELNPRINITLSTLSDPVQLRMYAEAGALSTDIAKLGTSNASYTVYAMDENGNPIKTKPIENGTPNLDANSDLEKADYKKKHSVYHKGTQYREKNGKWYDTNWKEVTEPTLLNQIKWASYIRANELTPNLVSNDKYGNRNNKYYVINPNETDAKVIKVFENGSIAELNIADSRTTLRIIREKEAKASMEEAAKRENERLEKLNNLTEQEKRELVENGEDVDLGETLTDEQLIAQGNGDFTSTAKPQPTDSEVKAQEVVDRITTNTHDIILNEKRGIYTDSTGKEYARVTSVIQATEGAERFDPNSPWILPSTRIGTGIDEFVRDFFAGKLGNLENLHERYPNATTPQLQAFEKQLRELKVDFDKRGLTIVPRDVTVTGEVEVTDTNGKKYKLSVAGTLDLLAYDKDGNFYIFDMKTNRSAPNDKKSSKWGKQLSLYKQFLEEKYGIHVKDTEIIPIEVSYPAPKGWSNATTEYSNKENQLYTNGTEYRDAKPVLHSNIPISTSPIKVEYNLLTNEERSMLSPVIDGTFNSTTGTTNKESVNKGSEDINKTGNKSLAELQASANANPTDANSILKNRTYGRRVREVLKEKGFNGKPSEAETWLKEHNMPTSNITDVDAWIDMLQNCR